MVQVNNVAILIAVVANFVLGWLWYGPLFGKSWAKEMGMSMDVKPAAGVMIKGMVLMIIGCYLTANVLAHDSAAWGMVPGMTLNDISAVKFGFMGGFFTWLGFYVPQHLSSVAWENKSWKLFGINVVYSFVALQVVAQIISHLPIKS